MPGEASITCPRCGRTSHHPNDVREGYCGHCHGWTGALARLVVDPAHAERGMFFDRQAQEITLARYAYLQGLVLPDGRPYRRVAEDHVDLYWVSTVWLGIDHGFGLTGIPIIFETMLFLDGTAEDMGMHRYPTEAEALAGHEAVVAELRVLAQRAADRERVQDGGTP